MMKSTMSDPSQLIDLRTKVSLETYIRLSEAIVRTQRSRGVIVETAISEYLDLERYIGDKAEYAEYVNAEGLHPNAVERMQELKKRIDAWEEAHRS